MTAIMVDIRFNKIYIFADGRETSGTQIHTDRCKKIYKREDKDKSVLFAFCGHVAPCNYYINKFMSFPSSDMFIDWAFEGEMDPSTPGITKYPLIKEYDTGGVIINKNKDTNKVTILSIDKESGHDGLGAWEEDIEHLPMFLGCGSVALRANYRLSAHLTKKSHLKTEKMYIEEVKKLFKVVSKVDAGCCEFHSFESIDLD